MDIDDIEQEELDWYKDQLFRGKSHCKREDLLEAAATGTYNGWDLTIRERMFADYAYEQGVRVNTLITAANELKMAQLAAVKAWELAEAAGMPEKIKDRFKTVVKAVDRFDRARREVTGEA